MRFRHHLKIGSRLGCGFGIVLVLTNLLGITAIIQMNMLANLTAKMYNHPLVVSNAVRDIRTNIVAMHLSMKNMVLAKSVEQLDATEEIVSEYEQNVLDSFRVISERFLGSKHDVEAAHKAFSDWKPIRQEVIDLMHLGRSDEASEISKGKGAKHVAYMNESIQIMCDFASKKADVFFNNTQDLRRRHLLLTFFLLALISGACVLVGIFITRSITKPIMYIIGWIGKIADGNFGHKINLERHDEIGQLAQAFDDLTENLERTTISRDELDAVNEQLQSEIIERKEAEKKQNELMEHLSRANQDLNQSNRALQEFAYIASHDLQEPLRKVLAFGDRLKDSCGDSLGEKGADYLERMQNAAGRMRTLINDLLTYSRVTTKAKSSEEVDLGRITNEVLSDLEVTIEKMGAKVEVGRLPILEADPSQMRQLMQNLISNALKFHKPDEAPVVKITSEISKHHSDETGTNVAEAELCRVIVEDNGIGFEQEYADKIFEMFQRLHGRSEYEGTGLGLAVCQKIVQRHNGTITAESSLGKGSRFIITFPTSRVKSEMLQSV